MTTIVLLFGLPTMVRQLIEFEIAARPDVSALASRPGETLRDAVRRTAPEVVIVHEDPRAVADSWAALVHECACPRVLNLREAPGPVAEYRLVTDRRDLGDVSAADIVARAAGGVD